MTQRGPVSKNSLKISGQKFGRLTVLERVQSESLRSMWRCMCECGTEKIAEGPRLTNGKTRSCGCLSREVTRDRNTRHGLRTTHCAEVGAWGAMHARCKNPKHAQYKHYGARGIRVCERWASAIAFIEDMGRRPSKRHSIDRINNDGNYEPSNCRWATTKQQSWNRRATRLLTFGSRIGPIAAWGRWLSVDPRIIVRRLSWGWSVAQIVVTLAPHRLDEMSTRVLDEDLGA